MTLLEQSEIFPEMIGSDEIQWVRDAHLDEKPNPNFLNELKAQGYKVTTQCAFDSPTTPPEARGQTPILYADVYSERTVPLPGFRVDPDLRSRLIEQGAHLVETVPADVNSWYQGGQKGGIQGGIFVCPGYGPIIAVTSQGDALAILDNILARYEGSQTEPYDATLFAHAVDETMKGMLTEHSRIPVGVVLFPETDERVPFAAGYFPDSQTVIGSGGLLDLPVSDGKTRAAFVWPAS